MNKLEISQQNKNYAIGLGIGNDGLAITGDINKVWIFADTDTVVIGYKIKF